MLPRLIEPCRLGQSSYLELFNERLRYEGLYVDRFTHTLHARTVIEVWRRGFNEKGPKKTLDSVRWPRICKAARGGTRSRQTRTLGPAATQHGGVGLWSEIVRSMTAYLQGFSSERLEVSRACPHNEGGVFTKRIECVG
ncbi:integrase core domain-containing protein [Dokdonella sp. MW10]|uniref:integrase core domain-containing protein n=1 Tax=Dokdonella sp. MW10 TaxID=2992926 RepID=UPI003F81373E